MSASRVKKTSPKKNARPKRKNPYSEENLTQSSDSRYLNADLVVCVCQAIDAVEKELSHGIEAVCESKCLELP